MATDPRRTGTEHLVQLFDSEESLADAVAAFLGMPVSGRSGILAPTGSHPGGDDHHDPIPDGPANTSAPIASAQEA